MTRREPIVHALRTLLDEELGGARPPDLLPEILARVEGCGGVDGADDDDGFDLVGVGGGGEPGDEFEHALRRSPRGVVREFWGFVHDHSKHWLLPFLIVIAAVGFALALGSTGAAPFIYTLF